MSEDKGRLDLQDLNAGRDTRGTAGTEPAPRPQEPCAPLADKPPAARGSDDLGAVYDLPVQLSAVLGKASMPVS
jgi:hypothetical protein